METLSDGPSAQLSRTIATNCTILFLKVSPPNLASSSTLIFKCSCPRSSSRAHKNRESCPPAFCLTAAPPSGTFENSPGTDRISAPAGPSCTCPWDPRSAVETTLLTSCYSTLQPIQTLINMCTVQRRSRKRNEYKGIFAVPIHFWQWKMYPLPPPLRPWRSPGWRCG